MQCFSMYGEDHGQRTEVTAMHRYLFNRVALEFEWYCGVFVVDYSEYSLDATGS